jgi:uncharacterized membrane protein
LTKVKKNIIFFSSGGVGYGMIELIWRGRTHWTMLIAGGVCFVIFSVISERCKKRTCIFKAASCALSVTLVELIFGIVFNLVFKMNVWDYSKMPFNLFGQVCLLYTLLWGVLGAAFLPLADYLNKKLEECR